MDADPVVGPGQVLMGDKGYRQGASFETELANAGITLIRPTFGSEQPRPLQRFRRPFRQIIESVNETLKPSSISNATAHEPNQASSPGSCNACSCSPQQSGTTRPRPTRTRPNHSSPTTTDPRTPWNQPSRVATTMAMMYDRPRRRPDVNWVEVDGDVVAVDPSTTRCTYSGFHGCGVAGDRRRAARRDGPAGCGGVRPRARRRAHADLERAIELLDAARLIRCADTSEG